MIGLKIIDLENKAMLNKLINLPIEKIESFCHKWKVAELWLFGSVLKNDFKSDSDLDFMVQFQNDAKWSLWDHAGMEMELEELTGRPVDLITKKGIEQSKNEIRKKKILSSARSIFRVSR